GRGRAGGCDRRDHPTAAGRAGGIPAGRACASRARWAGGPRRHAGAVRPSRVIVSDPQPSPQSVIAPALDLARVPPHIAIIMDGNGRWAAARGLPRAAGHRAGLEAVRRIIEACRRLGRDLASGHIIPQAVDEAVVGRYLYTAGLPDPDLLIRTGGEQRVSNFLLWQIAYTELYFCEVYWPDFDKPHLAAAIAEYQHRRRRFGGIEDA